MLLVFGDCVLDLDRRELSRASVTVATAPKVFDLLVYLAEHRERVVSRDDLIAAVWRGRIVSESTLASHINAVRKAVGDDGQQQRVIRTVARKGFRFAADVREAESSEGAGAARAEPDRSAEAPASAPSLPAKPSIHPREVAEGIRLARRAVELGRSDAVALTRSAHALGHLAGDLPGGIALLDKALVLNPNLAAAWFLGAFLRLWHGETEEAIAHFAHAMRLSPLDPELYKMQAGMAAAHLFAGRFDTAASWAEKALRELPSLLLAAATLAASHALAGHTAEARRAMDCLHELDPALRLSTITAWLPIRRPENLVTLTDGLRRAGMRE